MKARLTEVSFCSEIDYRLLLLIGQTRDALLKARAAELKSYGISAIEALALFVLGDLEEHATAAEVSRMMFRGHNTVSALLVRMQKKGLVNRYKDVERKNIWRVQLTEVGRLACRQAMQIESLHSAFSVLSDVDKQAFEAHVRSIRDKALVWARSEPVKMLP